MEYKFVEGRLEWGWKSMDNVEVDEELKRLMSEIFKNRKVLLTGSRDKVVWCGAKDGIYSVKIGYELLDKVIDHL